MLSGGHQEEAWPGIAEKISFACEMCRLRTHVTPMCTKHNNLCLSKDTLNAESGAPMLNLCNTSNDTINNKCITNPIVALTISDNSNLETVNLLIDAGAQFSLIDISIADKFASFPRNNVCKKSINSLGRYSSLEGFIFNYNVTLPSSDKENVTLFVKHDLKTTTSVLNIKHPLSSYGIRFL